MPVDGYEHHIAHRGWGEGEAHDVWKGTYEIPQEPAAFYQAYHLHWHHQQPDEEVGRGQGEQEEMSWFMKLLEVGDGDDDQQVEGYSQRGDAGEQRVQEDSLGARARWTPAGGICQLRVA